MIKRELPIFLVVGSLTVLVDFLSYRSLVWIQLLNVDMAKAVGFLSGTTFAYMANRFWTFGHKPHAKGSVYRFIVLYAVTLGTNVLINALLLAILSTSSISIEIAFLIATGVSATLNFVGMKFFVFKNSSALEMP